MKKILERPPSPTVLIAVLALIAALAGTAIADPLAGTSGALKKRTVKKISRQIAQREIDKAEPSLSVASAETAQSATNAETAESATNADTVDGRSAAELESRVFSATNSNGFAPAGAGTATMETLDLPAGTYLIVGRGTVDNNGDASLNEITCSLVAGASSARVGEALALTAQGTAGETEVTSGQLVHTFTSPGQVRLDCVTQAGWGSGLMHNPTISAISAQP